MGAACCCDRAVKQQPRLLASPTVYPEVERLDLYATLTSFVVNEAGIVVEATGRHAAAPPGVLGHPLLSLLHPTYHPLVQCLLHKMASGDLKTASFRWFATPPADTSQLLVVCKADGTGRVAFRQCPVLDCPVSNQFLKSLEFEETPGPDVLCPGCCRFHSGRAWLPAEQYYLRQLVSARGLPVSRVSHAICPDCHSELHGKSSSSLGVESVRAPAFHALVVDDDRVSLLIAEMYARKAGFHTTGVPDAEAALRHLAAHRVDLLITDMVLPGMDGLRLFETVRSLETQSCRVIGMSGAPEYRSRCLSAGVDAFLQKPFKRLEFNAALSKLWANSEWAEPPVAAQQHQQQQQQQQHSPRPTKAAAHVRFAAVVQPA